MFDPAILLNLEAHLPPELPPMVTERVQRDALGEGFFRTGTEMVDAFEAQAEHFIQAMATVQRQHQGIVVSRRASRGVVAHNPLSTAEIERAPEIGVRRAARTEKRVERRAKAEAVFSPSLATARRQIARRMIDADKRLIDAILDYALFLRAIRSEMDPAQEEGRTFDDAASLHDYLAGLGAA